MKALIQRVAHASVKVDGRVIGEIGTGLLVFLGVEKGDTQAQADKLIDRLIKYRVFSDEQGKMNLSLRDISGGLLLISQFTLAADTRKGLRPSFSLAAEPEEGKRLYLYALERARKQLDKVASGQFGADMKVELLNDGPVTFMLET